MYIIITTCISALFAVTVWGCAEKSLPESSPSPRVEVRTSIVRRGSIDEIISATGSTVVRREAQLRSPVTGVLAEFKYFNGDQIAKGTAVALVRSKESAAAMQGAEQLLAGAKNDRQREEAKQAVELAQNATSSIALRAPFDGILAGKAKNEMEVVSEGDAIASLIDPSSMIFVADIPSSSIRLLKQGEHARMRFNTKSEKWYRGTVHRVEPQANAADQTIRVQIAFDDANVDLAGSLFGEVSITTGRRDNVLLVPASALLHDDERNISNVVVVGPDSLAYHVDVRVGAAADSSVEISSPLLREGELVITLGHYGLPDSTNVRIVQ